MSSTNMVAANLSWFKLLDVTPQEWEPLSVQATSVKSTQGSSRYSESCLVAVIHAEVDVKGNSDLEVLSREAYHCYSPSQ